MKFLFKKTNCFFALLALVLFFLHTSSVSASVVCTSLTTDVYYGMVDPYFGGPVTTLQNFLSAEGYLTATPNGHFGPATRTAVMSFQSAHGISATGYVGPLTRTAIAGLSCTTPVISPTSIVSPSIGAPSSNVTAPLSGTNLSVGQTYTITWNGESQSGYEIILEDSTGLSQGFITPNSQISNSYAWKVGSVLSSATNTYTTVSPGTYRIHFESVSSGSPDLYSGNFTISAPPISVTAIMPTTASLATNPTMVIFGSGLNYSANIMLDGPYTIAASVLYTSPDGTVIVFSLPSSAASGFYNAVISNAYGGSATSSSFTITP